MRILLVDDDTTVLRAMLTVVRSLPGHTVVAASSADEAMETAASSGVDLLITDVVMEPTDGFSLNEQMQALYPGMRTIFLSGYDLSDYAERIGSWQVLMKPVDYQTIAGAVEREATALRAAAAPKVAVPVARPAAVAQPAAAPRAVAARPTAVAAPKAVAVPRAQPAAAPRAAAPVAQPRAAAPAVAQPRAAAPTAVPAQPRVAAPTVPAQPRPVAQPQAVPQPQARAVAPAPVAAAPEPSLEAQSGVETQYGAMDRDTSAGLIGQMIGGYQIVSQLGEGRWGTVYAAVQTAINRPVGLKVLDPVRAREETQTQRFIADARAKAHVQHPSILSVYEAGSADGWIFYTHEYVDGQNLTEMYSSGRTIDEITALKVLKVVAEGLLYLNRNNVPHAALQAGDIYLGIDGHPRLSNLAAQSSDQQLSVDQEIEVLGQAVWPVLQQPVSQGLQMLLSRTQPGNPGAITAWGALLQGIKALEPKIVPVEAEKISAQERAAAAAADKARKAQKRAFYLNLVSMTTLTIVAGWAVWYYVLRSNERILDEQVHIPAGEFVFGEGRNAQNPEFWVDKYEVTIGQYAKFVEWINANPGEEHAYDHERQPKQLSHVPQYWEIYYLNAKAGKAAHSTPIDLNCPVMTVTWWDAYAYAKWKGRQLPTEQEWERAARGKDGRAFPWGEDGDIKKANSSSDYQPNSPGAIGTVDGFNLWGPVDQQKYDKSPDGVIGMAGNVSEWTGTWTPDNTKPIVKGGNFSIPLMKLSGRLPMEPGKKEEFIGFRTVSHKAPEK